jgi:hypothetical protein
VPHDPYGDAADPRAAQDAAWRQIVENYGDRPLIDETHDGDHLGETDGDVDEAEPVPELRPAPLVRAEPAEEHFVPPPPPPVPTAEPHRMLAWLGLFGAPVIVLVALLVKFPIPSWFGFMLMAWFVGGFVFLVASMHGGPRDEDDDGAVV